jgi:serine/threonine protein phosphatase PrpC
MIVDAFGMSDAGSRDANEDRILVDNVLGLYVICDGMGGHHRGEVAAELAISAIRHFIEATKGRLDVTWPFGYDFDLSIDGNRLGTSVRLANRQVWRRAEQSIEYAGMGTTIAAVLVNGDQVTIANVGDSRVYRLRGGALTRLTVDDTMVDSMVRRGLLTPEEVLKHPLRNVLTRAAGSQDTIDVHLADDTVQPGDVFLLSSDGLHGTVKDHVIGPMLACDSSEECITRLLEAAKNAGGPDNISAVVLRYS